MQQHVVPVRHFTWTPGASIMVTESSDLEILFNTQRLPEEITVQGARQAVLYRHSPAHTIYDAGREDVVARVWQPVGVAGLPEIHVLND